MESNASKATVSNNENPQYVVMSQPFHTLLNKVKEIEQVSTYLEVLDTLKLYIIQKRLYGIADPTLISCQSDELGSVFGVPEFTLYELKNLLRKVLTIKAVADPFGGTSASDSLKRKYEDGYAESSKKMCTQECLAKPAGTPMYLEIPDPVKYDSSSESNFSVQSYETVFVKNSSDEVYSDESEECTENIIAIQKMYNLEYEVETDSDSSKDETATDSEVEEALHQAILDCIRKNDSDVEFWADRSSEEDFDLEISELDQWKCAKCGSLNAPLNRFCLRCWEERIGWLPDKKQTDRKHPPRRKRKNKSKSKEWKDSSNHTASETAGSSQESMTQASQEDSTSVLDHKMCYMCCSKPLNASIVHGKIGHQVSCYRCARKLQSQKKPCPMCRRTIDRVIHLISF